jgi:hypothetical protein
MFGGSLYVSHLVRVDGYFKSYLPIITMQWEIMDTNNSRILAIRNQHRKIIRNIIDDVFWCKSTLYTFIFLNVSLINSKPLSMLTTHPFLTFDCADLTGLLQLPIESRDSDHQLKW